MRTLVVYYSLEGNTKDAAEKIAASLGADLMRLVPIKDIPKKGLLKFLHGGGGATKGQGTELQPYTADVSSYDATILGTPVWAGKPCMAVNQFISDLAKKDKVVGAWAIAASGKCDKCLDIMKKELPSIRVTVGLADRNSTKQAAGNEVKLDSFISNLRKEFFLQEN